MALPEQWTGVYSALEKLVRLKWFGVNIGEIKGKDMIPSHALALSNAISQDIQYVDTDRAQALRFLKKETIELPEGIRNGWTLVRHQGLNLGWIKVMPGRMNNYRRIVAGKQKTAAYRRSINGYVHTFVAWKKLCRTPNLV
jgi:NOL1/NOP2/fmu family ribosome biogenesis protein